MDNTNFENYAIDAADIWEYERDHYDGKEEHRTGMKELYEVLKLFYLKAGHKPFIQSKDDSPYARGYRERYKNRTVEEVTWTYFVYDGAVYAMGQPCEISLNEQNKMSFQKLFILKLSQYSNGLLYLKPFLTYQLKNNFKDNLNRFRKFWNISLLQYPGKTDNRISYIVEDWFAELETKKAQRDSKQKTRSSKVMHPEKDAEVTEPAQQKNKTPMQGLNQEGPETGVTLSPFIIAGEGDRKIPGLNQREALEKEARLQITENEEPVKTTTGQTIPEGYEEIPGSFTHEEIIHYFSFLYKEKSTDGQSFLSEKEVREIFKYGLAIPSSTETQKYKLNCSLKFPKGIVEFCIYKFIAKHTRPHNKRKVLKFFAHYIADFASHIKSEKAFNSWSSNVVGKRPEKMGFALKDYLPDRMRN